MSHREYNVGYINTHGTLALAFQTPTNITQANKRLTKIERDGGLVELVWGSREDGSEGVTKVKRQAFLIYREISDWKPS